MIHYEYVQEIPYELLTIENTLNCILKFFPSEEQIEEEAEKAKVAEDVVEEEVEVIDEEEVVQEAEEKIRYLCKVCAINQSTYSCMSCGHYCMCQAYV